GPQGVGGGPVFRFFGGGPLFHQLQDGGGHFVLFAVVQQAQHPGQLVKDGGGGLQRLLRGGRRQGVDLLDQVEEGGQGVGGVQVVVHGGAEFGPGGGGLLFQLPAGAKAALPQDKVQVFPAGVQPLEAVLAALDQLDGVVQGHPVAGRQHEIADGLVAVGLGHVPHGEEVVQALGHLLVVHVDKAVVHPVAGKGAAVGALALGDLVFVVGEDQVLPAAVQVDGLAQVGAAHGAALDVPAGTAGAVGAVPGGLAGLGGLPDGKVGGVLLQVVVHLAAQGAVAALQVVQVQVAQLAVLGVAAHPEIDVPVAGHIGVAAGDQVGHDAQDLPDVLGGAGLDGGGQAVQAGGVLFVLGLEPLGHRLHGGALLVGPGDELVVDVGDVGDIDHLVAPVLQTAAQGVKDDQGTRVAGVDGVVDGGPADVDAVDPGLLGYKVFLLPCKCIENLHGSSVLFSLPVVGCSHYTALRPPLQACPFTIRLSCAIICNIHCAPARGAHLQTKGKVL